MFIPPQGLRHAVDLLLKNGIRSGKPPALLAETLVQLAKDMKAPPEAAEWIAAEYTRLFGSGLAGDEILERLQRSQPRVERRDLFLVYVPEDRLTAAGPLAVELAKRRLTVALSQYEVERPEDLPRVVAHGFEHHRAGALLLTPEFERKKWDLESLDTRLLILRDLAHPPALADQLAARLAAPPPPADL